MIAVNEKGVAALNQMSQSVGTGCQGITSACQGLVDEIDGIGNLGPHKASIKNVAESIQQEVQGATSPAKTVEDKLKEKAQEYQNFIQNDRFR